MNRAEEDALVLEAINGATSRNDVDGVEAIRLAIRAAVAQERERAAKVCESPERYNERDERAPVYKTMGIACAAAIRRGEE